MAVSSLNTEQDKQKFNPVPINNDEFFVGIQLSDEEIRCKKEMMKRLYQ